jgi:ribosomal protein S18 acetylase RimI-like enzyme
MFTIERATDSDLADVARLFRDYAASLSVDLAYQDFESEVANLPGKYAPPRGALLLARDAGGKPSGCVALRPIEPAGCCEMKRLYVPASARGSGLGVRLVQAILREAERAGYREMRLDTLPDMHAALSLYRKSGFEEMRPYYDSPVGGTVYAPPDRLTGRRSLHFASAASDGAPQCRIL